MKKVVKVLRQRNWTEVELRAAHFHYYEPRKRVVMVQVLKDTIHIKMTLETLVARTGSVICYDPGAARRERLEDYDHWPVRADLFQKTYRPWREPDWHPNAAESHLMQLGCLPYYKHTGVWAQRLTRPIYLQSLESPQPVLVPPGRWLCIGSQGEPYHMNDQEFRERYLVPVEDLP